MADVYTIFNIPAVPRIDCNVGPDREDPNRFIKIAIAGYIFNYPGDLSTPTAGLLKVKLLIQKRENERPSPQIWLSSAPSTFDD